MIAGMGQEDEKVQELLELPLTPIITHDIPNNPKGCR